MVNLLVSIALMFILFKIPFWILSSIRVGNGGSFIGSLVKGFLAYKTFGLLGGGGGRAPRPRGGPKPSGPSDPYANTKATSSGQYMLPLEGIKRGRAPKPPHQRYAPKPSAQSRPGGQGTQLSLPLDGEWPENKPRVGRDGQYRLPLDVQRQPAPKPAAGPPARPSSAPRGRQLKFPASGEWPENRPRLGRDGQYRLPMDARRVRKPAPAPAPPHPRPSSAGRQLKFPADGEWPENKPRVGRDGQYQLPLNVQRTRKPAPPPSGGQPPTTPRRGPRPRQQSLPLDLPKVHPPRPSTRREGGEK
ncbi:hypothetical protein HFP15_31060 [Amycolatopsis sp. K13G38]|uniref:Uncharacterized protein n=1 Tax=Amycolatopsis acididurans TaxID=2724524 RepID=A0ABX1JBZ6_9PSEU|nr:hypothetical protein [Amycolatopsis acididurans]